MVRETRHLWVGNLPDNIREDRIREHFKRYGRVQSVKLLPRGAKEEAGESAMACTVAFMDIKSASKAHNAEHKLDDRTLTTEYYEPAAIPSSASPQNTPSSYSTSPGSTRFPNGHGSAEEHANFNDRFYERPNNRVTEGEFIRRTNYHDNCRGRNRDRSYRNGPYNAIMDRSHRTLNNSWSSYDSTRYNSQNETGYVSTTPSDSNERRSSDQSTKKKTKSRSGSRSPSPSGSASSRSPSRELQQACDCRSRSRSSSSSSGSSTSRDTSSSSERRPLAICVKNLPPRSSDTSLKDGLFHEYKKHGKVTWVKVVGQGSERYAIVCFKKPEDVEKALEVSYDKLFFGCKIEVESYQGHDVEDNDLRPYEAEIDEFHPKATRTLFIGNLEKDVTASDLRKHFDQFGEIIEIDIKKQGAVGSYAFCQYSDIVSVVKAIRTMDGEHLGNNRIKLGFGKSMPTNCVWVDGIVENVNEKYLRMQFEPFGSISKVHVDRDKGQALIFYEQVVGAQLAVNKMRGFSMKGNKIQVDFASRECQESFFEHLEKQGTVLVDRPSFETVSRTFDATTNRFSSRYDTPTRPRTSSYSSRSSAAASQVTSAIPSPGTPGSVTPRGTGSRSRIARFAEYYDPASEYSAERHFRNYDEYSQGSGASHEDGYEHEYAYTTSPSHVDMLDARTIQSVVSDHAVVPFVQPDIRNLQKERVHLLEQLEECPSSGDELIGPKKRLKLDLLDNVVTSDVIIEANRDHRKVMEVRRLSDPNLKHHSRRPSIDSKHDSRSSSYMPHAVCKRRKTAGSDSGSKTHHYDYSGSESVGGSRPGTPLVDERPEHFPPSEPRRIPREREGPLTLPLPRFAAQVMNRGSVSVAGIKGQKDNILSSPPPAVTSPRISNPKPPSPVHVPPPASPPPRPPSLSSNSSDSDVNPPSPSLDERIRSLDEKYEKWSGSRALSAAGGEALAKLDATREKFRLRHKLLDLDLKEVQPSDIVKSVMAKRSVFDEDLKRLENVGEKYEPKEFTLFPRTNSSVTPVIPATPLSAPPILKVPPATQLPKTPTMLSPRSAGANVTAAKGLQYPFPSHPPVQLAASMLHTPPPGTPTPQPSATTTFPPTSTTSTIITTRGTSHGDTRLKPCPSVPSDNRTSSKVNVNRSGIVAPIKTNSEKNSVNIPNTNDASATGQPPPPPISTCDKSNVKTVKTTNDKIMCRRDSNSNSPRGDTIKTRRNSDVNIKKPDESGDPIEKIDEKLKIEQEKAKLEKEKAELLEKERLERERERERELEQERLEQEKQQRLEKEENERREREEQLERERIELEKREREERERRELEARLQEKLEKERLEREREQRRKESDNHEKRKEEHRHRENNHLHETKPVKDMHETVRRDSHDSNKSRHHSDVDRRKESVKENRDNNIHEKQKTFQPERMSVESRHMSIDFDRSKIEASKRKERNNSLPANIGLKRRISSHESVDGNGDDAKRAKKISERRDSKSKHKNNSIKSYDKHNSGKESDEKRKERDERHKSKQQRLDKHKIKSKSREKDSRESPSAPKSPSKELTDKDFLARLDLRSNEEIEKQRIRKEKKKLENEQDEKKDDSKKLKDKCKVRDEASMPKINNDDRKCQKKDKIRKLIHNSSDNNSDSDEPKKHSIFDIVDDEPAYISMYDKVKARSCKNMQKQEEEKRQEKIKAKFSQLKQSRAKREEKKRSTSWDEDSDSDREKSDISKTKRNKMLIMSSDEEDQNRKIHKKREIYSDSDSERPRRIKSEQVETSEDDGFRSKQQHKGSKSRITSDTSEDEIKKIQNRIKSEIYSDNEVDQGFADLEDKPFAKNKDEITKLIKKEKNNKHQDSLIDQMNAQIFGDSSSPVLDIKSSFNSRHSFAENSSGDENNDMKKERKKHKKKQKRQKHSLSTEDSSKLEPSSDHHDKKKQHSRKDKKRDKTKDDRERSKKSKKNKSELKSDSRRDGKMENIFGSLSEDSESGVNKDPEHKSNNSFIDRFTDNNVTNSDSDREHVFKFEEKERKRKEKKRREKERRLQEESAAVAVATASGSSSEQLNENSMDYADMGKQLEANIKDDSMDEVKHEEERFNNDSGNEFHENKKEERKEPREKKKKRKKSKEEKQKHHHHHHHDKNKIKSEHKKESDETTQNSSLPDIIDVPSVESRETILSPTTSKDKRDKFIPGFGGAEIDEKIHENAVKSISDFDSTNEVKTEETVAPAGEEKPRVTISQEETEDAVAALLGESFGFEECYNEEDINTTNDQTSTITDDNINIAQDDEEMRQAVQSLSTADIDDAKPETPQSEHELQIDTDTEEQEESSTTRFDQPPKTPEITPVLPPPKTPEVVPSYPRVEEQKTVLKTAPTSPPSLTPIKPCVEKKLEENKSAPLSLPVLSEQPRSVIAPSPPQIVTQSSPLRTYGNSVVKSAEISYPPLTPITNEITSLPEQTKIQTFTVLQGQRILHNLPACSPVPPKTSSAADNRLPITPIVVPKPMQPATVMLQQPKVAVSTSSEPERPRMIFQTAPSYVQSQPRMVVQRNLPSQELLVAPRQLPITPAYNYVQPQFSLNPIVNKETSSESVKPTIIVSTSSTVTKPPFIPVIKEAPPKLVTLPQTPVIKSTESLIKEAEPEPKAEIKSPPPKVEEVSKPLAIEKVTEELNLTLKKETTVTTESKEPETDSKPVKTEADEEKAETESVVSDVSKEQTAKDDALDNKEDSDYWSAKEVNIDSVIKTLCSADELSDHSNEWFDDSKNETDVKPPVKKEEQQDAAENAENSDTDAATKGAKRGGRARGRKARGGIDRSTIQTRRGKIVPVTVAKRGGRGGARQKIERKSSKSESEVSCNDIYEFRDDSDENNANKERPRLILTIKSPSLVKEEPETKEEFVSPVTNTRKSRRLQERDVLRNTVDDTIEDVVRNTRTARRSTRQAVVTKTSPESPRKSPRGGKKKDRRASDPCENITDEKTKTDLETKSESDITEIAEKTPKMKPHEGLKASMLRRVKGEMIQEPMTLIDPVTGLLTPMRECEEGRYIPLPKTSEAQKSVIATAAATVTTTATPPPPVSQKAKPQSLKAHVLSSQAAKAVVSQQPQLPVQTQQQQPIQVKKSNVIVSQQPIPLQQPDVPKPITQSLNVNVSVANYTTACLSPRPNMPVNVLSKVLTGVKPAVSPGQMASLAKQQILQATKQQTPVLINTQVAHIKQPVISKAKPPHNLHQQQILTGSVASPPLNKGASQNLIVRSKGIMEPPKIDGPRTNLSPSQPRHVAQSALPVPAYEASLHGERSLYNRSRSPPPAHQNSPSPQGEAIAHFPPGSVPLRPPHDLPPAHYMHASHVMQYPFLRQPYHLPRSPMIAGGLEKTSDGQEGEEAPVTSPPLELRRPSSVGLALTGRTAVVPHSLHSPHDRTTDSPQVGQVYNMHAARMQHYHSTGRYYEQTAEPPPAHRPLTSSLSALANDRTISHMASLGASERPMSGHMQPDRPLSSHSALSAHMGGLGTPERPLSNHGLTVGAGLGAAGNLMGAVARHVGVDAPTSQRGLQAATPPHASQVPPQAESLFMLLKQYPCMWQGLLALKNDQAAVQMYFVSGNDSVAKCSLPKNTDGSTPPLRIFQRMRLEPPQVEGVARKMQMENEHCMLLALPCGHDHMDVLKQSTNLTNGFITYLQQKQAAGIVNVAAPGTTQPPAYVVHIFPSCDFVNENLRRIAPSLLERVADIAHLLIVITTV